MNNNNFRMFLFICLSIILNVLLLNENNISSMIDIDSFSIPMYSFIASVVFALMFIVKPKTSIIFNFNRLGLRSFYFVFGYFLVLVSCVLTFVYFYEIVLWQGIMILLSEFFILFLFLCMKVNNIEYAFKKVMLRYKDLLFFGTMLVLILQNMPFALYDIPLDIVLVTSYCSFVVYFVYRLLEVIYLDQKVR